MARNGITIPVECSAVQALVDEVHMLAQRRPLPAQFLAGVERLGPDLVIIETHHAPLRIVAEPTESMRALVRQARAWVEAA